MGQELNSTEVTMRLLLLSLLPLAFAAKLAPHQQQLVDRFGEENVNFDKNVRTQFCDTCLEITVESSGGAAEHQPNRLGTFTRDGSLWENMVPFWLLITSSTSPPTPSPTPSSTTSSGWCPRLWEDSTLVL